MTELRRGLRESETADDSRTLLKRLRKRQDLLAIIAEQIDELLENSRRPAVTKSEIIAEESGGLLESSRYSPVTKSEIITWRERLLGAFFGAIAGAIYGAISGNLFLVPQS